jgi:hypothetical protein
VAPISLSSLDSATLNATAKPPIRRTAQDVPRAYCVVIDVLIERRKSGLRSIGGPRANHGPLVAALRSEAQVRAETRTRFIVSPASLRRCGMRHRLRPRHLHRDELRIPSQAEDEPGDDQIGDGHGGRDGDSDRLAVHEPEKGQHGARQRERRGLGEFAVDD